MDKIQRKLSEKEIAAMVEPMSMTDALFLDAIEIEWYFSDIFRKDKNVAEVWIDCRCEFSSSNVIDKFLKTKVDFDLENEHVTSVYFVITKDPNVEKNWIVGPKHIKLYSMTNLGNTYEIPLNKNEKYYILDVFMKKYILKYSMTPPISILKRNDLIPTIIA